MTEQKHAVEDDAKIGVRLQAVMQDLRPVGKDSESKGGKFNFKFRGIDAVVNEINPLFAKHGVSITKKIVAHSYDEVAFGGEGKMAVQARVKIVFRYTSAHDSDDFREDEVIAEALDQGDKATAKVMSVALRTSLIQVLLIPTGEPDPDEDQYERNRNGGNGSQQQNEAPAELPATEKKLLDDATTVDELKAIGAEMRTNANLSPAVTKVLGYYWQKRMGEVLAKAANDATEGGANARVGATQDTLDN